MPGVKCQSTGSIMGYGVCENTFDGQVSGRGGEWITNHATLPTITIDFNRKAKIHEIGILNRCSFNGQAKDLSIEFSDKSVHAVCDCIMNIFPSDLIKIYKVRLG